MENLERIELSKEAIARLIASKETAENEDYSDGYEGGKRWAEVEAEWRELSNLLSQQGKTPEALPLAILKDAYRNELTWEEINEWLEEWVGADFLDIHVAGFIDGALAVWREICLITEPVQD